MAVVFILNFLELGFLCQGTRPLKHTCRHRGELCGKEQAGAAEAVENRWTPLGNWAPQVSKFLWEFHGSFPAGQRRGRRGVCTAKGRV